MTSDDESDRRQPEFFLSPLAPRSSSPTPIRSATASSSATCSARTARRCRSGSATIFRRTKSSTATAPMRCAGTSSPTSRRGPSIRYNEQAIKDSIPEFLLRLWNVYSFFVIYANIDGFDPAAEGCGVQDAGVGDLDCYAAVRGREVLSAG